MDLFLDFLAKAVTSIAALMLAAWALQFHRPRCPRCRRRGLRRQPNRRYRCDHCKGAFQSRLGGWIPVQEDEPIEPPSH